MRNHKKNFWKNHLNSIRKNQSNIEFFSWYRQYDRPEGTCVAEQEEIGDVSIELGGGSGLGSSEFVIERLNHYVCSAGLIDVNGNPKSGWNELKTQIEMIN